MSGAAHRGDDDLAFYAADIGETRLVSADALSNQQTTDADGALVPGRWLVQVFPTDSAAKVWVGFGKFVAAVVLSSPVGPGKQRIPCSGKTIIAFETNVLKGYSDRAVARTTVGTAEVYLTLISRRAK